MEDKNSNNMLKKAIAEERLKAVSFFEDAPCYPVGRAGPDVAFGTAA